MTNADPLRKQLLEEGTAFDQQQAGSQPSSESPPPRKSKPAKYEQMKRIEGRIRPAQEVRLDNIRRALIDRRTAPGERITNNTLLRVALAGLIAHKDVLHGNTEKEIEESWLNFLRDASAARDERSKS